MPKNFHINQEFVAKTCGFGLVNVSVLYHLPDYQHILQELHFQMFDYNPNFPNIHQYITWWKANIDGRLESVYVTPTNMLITPLDYLASNYIH